MNSESEVKEISGVGYTTDSRPADPANHSQGYSQVKTFKFISVANIYSYTKTLVKSGILQNNDLNLPTCPL